MDDLKKDFVCAACVHMRVWDWRLTDSRCVVGAQGGVGAERRGALGTSQRSSRRRAGVGHLRRAERPALQKTTKWSIIHYIQPSFRGNQEISSLLTASLMPVSLPAGSLGRDNGLGGGTMAAVPRGVVGLFGGGTVHGGEWQMLEPQDVWKKRGKYGDSTLWA